MCCVSPTPELRRPSVLSVYSARGPIDSHSGDQFEHLGGRASSADLCSGAVRATGSGALAELHRSGAKYLLMIHVRDVPFSYRAILSARGTVQLAVLGTDGVSLFAKTVSTDTVVGARGDRHQALVYQVASQAFDILLPEFRKLVNPPNEPVDG